MLLFRVVLVLSVKSSSTAARTGKERKATRLMTRKVQGRVNGLKIEMRS